MVQERAYPAWRHPLRQSPDRPLIPASCDEPTRTGREDLAGPRGEDAADGRVVTHPTEYISIAEIVTAVDDQAVQPPPAGRPWRRLARRSRNWSRVQTGPETAYPKKPRNSTTGGWIRIRATASITTTASRKDTRP